MSRDGLFVGREDELARLLRLKEKRTASLAVLKGRRRVGKSRLAREYGAHFERSIIITGLPPDPGVDAQAQRDDFAQQLVDDLGVDRPKALDWGHLLRALADQVRQGSVLVVLDEVQARIERLRPPRGFSIRPVLIHASAVTPAVSEAEFFASIVDFATYLKR